MITPDLYTKLSIFDSVLSATLIIPLSTVFGLKPFAFMTEVHARENLDSSAVSPDKLLNNRKPEADTSRIAINNEKKKNFTLLPRAISAEFISPTPMSKTCHHASMSIPSFWRRQLQYVRGLVAKQGYPLLPRRARLWRSKPSHLRRARRSV